MVGDGELRPDCEELATRHSSLAALTFTGFLNQTQIVEAYVAADILVLSSDAGETWGLVVNEAMACGRPAIVSSLSGCCEDLVVAGETGWSFEFGDWTGLAEIMISAGVDAGLLRSMGDRCRQRIAQFSPEVAAKGIVDAVLGCV
jgi:glycosyltransferase involved in cell wall biosynthesis